MRDIIPVRDSMNVPFIIGFFNFEVNVELRIVNLYIYIQNERGYDCAKQNNLFR